MAISNLSFTNNMSANKRPFLTDVVESLTSIQTYINTYLTANLNQTQLDGWGSGYAYDNDGAANFSNMTLYDKVVAEDSYTASDYTISTTGAWTDLDATNASVSITPELAGGFKATFQFCVSSVTSNATNETDIRFRLTDSSENSTMVPNVKLVTGVTATTNIIPVTLIHYFDSWSAAAKTVKLQYYITTTTATTIKVLANSTNPLYMMLEKV